jgi:hypothetical protein
VVSGGGGGGGIPGAAPRGYNSASGGIPGVTSPISTVTSNLGDLSGIINSITSTQSGALKDQYPDEYFNVLGTLLGNTQRRASGDISDLLPELQTGAAESALYGGVSGSGAANTKLLRDMGLTRYGVQNNAIDALSKIQGQIPTVRPYDPSAIIGSQLDAQERADMYAAAPVPEDAYQRALQAAGGGGGGATGGKTYSSGGGGGGTPGKPTGPLSAPNWGPNMAPQYGTAINPMGGAGASVAPWGAFSGNTGLPPGFWDDPAAALVGDNFDPMWDTNPVTGDFGGSLNYGGGAPYDYWNSPQNQQTAQNYDTFDPWFASMIDVGGGVDLSGGGGFYGGGEDFGLADGGFYDEWY